MAKFNLKKLARSHYPVTQEKDLETNRDEFGQSEVANPGNLDWLLQKNHKEEDAKVHFQKRLSAERKGSNTKILEGKLDENTGWNPKRNDKISSDKVKAPDLMSEAYDQAKLRAFRKAQDPDRDTSFWDDYVGKQLLGTNTTIKSNIQSHQIENHPSRFNNLDKTMPITGDQQENRSRMDKSDKVKDMVTAESLNKIKEADSMLFHVYATAAKENRPLDKSENQIVADINSAKLRVLSE